MPEPHTTTPRRTFLKDAALGAAALVTLAPSRRLESMLSADKSSGFDLNYAPMFGTFEHHAGKDPLDQIRFMADQGFHAMFDNGLMDRSAAEQEAIARETSKLGMQIGPFVAYADFSVKSFVTGDPAVREMMSKRLAKAIETSMRTGAKAALVVPGRFDESLDWDYQTANVIENLKYCAGLCEKAGLVIVIEPLNPKDHPGLFLTKMSQAFQIAQAVGNPSCKIVEDIYHQQITEGNIIPNIDRAWEQIGAFHVGDTPGRNEPGTGELNYRSIFRHLKAKGYKGVVCLEHGKSKQGKEGEIAFIEAYRQSDM